MPQSKEFQEQMRNQVSDKYQSGNGYKAISKALRLQQATERRIIHKWREYARRMNQSSVASLQKLLQVHSDKSSKPCGGCQKGPRKTTSELLAYLYDSTIKNRLSENGIDGRVPRLKPLLSKRNSWAHFISLFDFRLSPFLSGLTTGSYLHECTVKGVASGNDWMLLFTLIAFDPQSAVSDINAASSQRSSYFFCKTTTKHFKAFFFLRTQPIFRRCLSCCTWHLCNTEFQNKNLMQSNLFSMYPVYNVFTFQKCQFHVIHFPFAGFPSNKHPDNVNFMRTTRFFSQNCEKAFIK